MKPFSHRFYFKEIPCLMFRGRFTFYCVWVVRSIDQYMSRAETLLNLLKMTLKDISKMDDLKSNREIPDESDTLEMKLFSDFVDH